MLQSSSEFNNLGAGVGTGGFGGFGGGFGGIAPFGLFGLLGLGGRNGLFGGGEGEGHRHGGEGREERNELATLAAISNLKDVSVAEARALATGICGLSDRISDAQSQQQQANYAAAIQAINNTNEIKGQAQAFQIANDNTLNQLSRQIAADGDLTRSLINQNEINNLRDALLLERRKVDSRELEISITNSNANINQNLQNQSQQQQHLQMQRDFDVQRRFDFIGNQISIGNQLAKNTQDVINTGLMVGTSQTASPTNIKS